MASPTRSRQLATASRRPKAAIDAVVVASCQPQVATRQCQLSQGLSAIPATCVASAVKRAGSQAGWLRCQRQLDSGTVGHVDSWTVGHLDSCSDRFDPLSKSASRAAAAAKPIELVWHFVGIKRVQTMPKYLHTRRRKGKREKQAEGGGERGQFYVLFVGAYA